MRKNTTNKFEIFQPCIVLNCTTILQMSKGINQNIWLKLTYDTDSMTSQKFCRKLTLFVIWTKIIVKCKNYISIVNFKSILNRNFGWNKIKSRSDYNNMKYWQKKPILSFKNSKNMLAQNYYILQSSRKFCGVFESPHSYSSSFLSFRVIVFFVLFWEFSVISNEYNYTYN